MKARNADLQIGDRGPGVVAMATRVRDPFTAHLPVPVAGGTLHLARSGPPPDEASAVVMAVHGVTSSHVAWRAVARELEGTGVCLLAPDLRGRGGSEPLPGPYGFAAHIADLLAVLDHVGAKRVAIAGHSMGAHVAVRLAAGQPKRVGGVVLLDGGLPLGAPLGDMDDDLGEDAAPALDRMEKTFASVDDYVAGWRAHPAFRHAWSGDVEAYARYEASEDERGVRCRVSELAILVDGMELMSGGATRAALERLQVPVSLLRAERGLFDDDNPAITERYLRTVLAEHPRIRAEHVADVNHYTLLLGAGPGPGRVAAAIAEAAWDAAVS
jgi:pimeloyl-ACP methyl ester carboxylesterase